MSVADVFRDLAKAKAKEAEASLATDDDRRRFLNAARGFLAHDAAFLRVMRSKDRTRLLSDPIDSPEGGGTVVKELLHAVGRLAKERMPGPTSADFPMFAARLLMADLIYKGLACSQDRQVLGDAARILWELQHELRARRYKRSGATRHNRNGDSVRENWARTMAYAWRTKHPDRPSSEGFRWVHRQAERQNFEPWPTQAALRLWMHRKGIRI
jgi:hypothetical protein